MTGLLRPVCWEVDWEAGDFSEIDFETGFQSGEATLALAKVEASSSPVVCVGHSSTKRFHQSTLLMDRTLDVDRDLESKIESIANHVNFLMRASDRVTAEAGAGDPDNLATPLAGTLHLACTYVHGELRDLQRDLEKEVLQKEGELEEE